ncbi:MAG: hypothetical protein GF384_06875 [Elusimicrobia bacterium]|nr:hypothetical protein [Elusimicrobiota bacterium]MBD3412421.1 hypothetical protein [Elusimicrobiota bacterium]
MKPNRILIIQLRRIGDVIFTVPVIDLLRRAYPDSRIDFLVEKPGSMVVRGHPSVNDILVYEPDRPWHWISCIRKRSYDLVVDFFGNPRSAILTGLSTARIRAGYTYPIRQWLYNHRVKRPVIRQSGIQTKLDMVRSLGIPTEYLAPRIYLSDNEKAQDRVYLQKLGVDGAPMIVGFAPVSRRETRRWIPEYYAQLAACIHRAYDALIMVFWGPGEEDVARAIQMHAPYVIIPPLTTIREMAGLIGQCTVLVSNDNGPKHIAEALNVPTLTIYGPTDPISWESGTVTQEYIRDEKLDCIGCNSNLCHKGLICMRNVTPSMVMERFDRLVRNIVKVKTMHAGQV